MVTDVSGQTVGLIVDAVHEVVTIKGSGIEPSPPTFILEAQYIEGIGKMEGRLVILRNVDRMMSTQETVQRKQSVQAG